MRFPCTHQAPASCPECSGEAAEEREYFTASPDERRRYNREMTGWWLRNSRCTRASQPVDFPAPREESA